MTKTILILAANPTRTSERRLDQEVRDIEDGLRRSQQRDQFILKQKWAVQSRDIQRAMLDYKPQIVHFSGQGTGEDGLVFEDEAGQPKQISGTALAALFELFSSKLECVVLNGCYSQVQAEAIAQHIPYVIGMNQAIEDRAAIEFAVGFYDALSAGESVEFAYKLGCVAIQMAGVSGELTPVLLRKPEGSVQAVSKVTPAIASPMAVPSAASSTDQPIEVFFSYAYEDEKLRDELAKHLKLLERQKVIAGWHDRDITAGQEWDEAIQEQLNRAKIILLLISADFLSSDFCWGVELEQAMQRHAARDACVVPIILREVDWKSAPFGKLRPLPKDGEPVMNWRNRDQAFTDIAKGIRKLAESLKK